MDIEENVPEITSPILPDIELQKKKEEARERYKKLSQRGKKPVIKVVTGDGIIKAVDKLTVKEQEEQFIKCALDPIYFIETYLKIFDQTQGENGMIVPFKLFEFQKYLISQYIANDFNIANKYRQAGISTCTCAYLSWYVMFNKNRSVAIIADKLGTAQDELMNDVVEFIEGCPTWLKPKPTRKNTQKLKRYDNGSEIGAFAAKSGLRGYTPTLLFWDETAWTEKSDKFWESAGPTLQTGGSAVMVSCVTDDTYLFTDKGIKQVKDFTNNKKEGENYIDDTKILGFNNLRKTNIFFNNGYVDTLKIETMYSELESSLIHKYWGYKNGKYNWFKAEELNVGDYVSIQKNKNIWGSNDDCSDFTPYSSGKIKNVFNPTKITKDLAYFIGLYISEGYIRRSKTKKNGGQIIITCGDDVSNIYKKLNIPYRCSDGIHYVTNSYNLLEFFEYLGFNITKKAPEKTIPSRLLEMSRENIIAMIQGIMDGDGFATYKEKGNQLRIGITSSSKELINQLKIIFNNFGILTDYDERITPPTKKVKVYSKGYRIMATSEYAKKYFDEIGFRFERKNEKKNLYKLDEIGHVGVRDNIPNGRIILKELYDSVKYYGIYEKLELNNIKIKSIIQKKNEYYKPCSRKTILKFINLFKNELSVELLNKYKHILNEDIVWVKVKSIEKSKNYTYDFSMSNDNPVEDDEFNMSIIYNQFLTHQTPNGFDPVFYKTFNLAIQKKNNFKAIELYWFNDPRYNKNLKWYKNRGNEDEIVLPDQDFTNEKRLQLYKDNWEPFNDWMDAQYKRTNGDIRKINQEIKCAFLGSGDNFIAGEYLGKIEEKQVQTPIRQEYVDSNMWIWEDPIPSEEYIMSIDVSSGHGDDYSTINMLKLSEFIENVIVTKNGIKTKQKVKKYKIEQVAEYYGKVSPQTLGEIGYIYGSKYNNAYTVIDITSGHGGQTVGKLFEMGYTNIHYCEIAHKPSRDMLNGYIKKGKKTLSDGSIVYVDLVPGFFIGSVRASVLIEFQRAIHMGDLIIRSKRTSEELKTFITVGGSRIADHGRSFHDDSIMGMAIGVYTINFDMKKYKINDDSTKDMINTILNINNNEKPKKDNRPSLFDRGFNNPYGANAWLFKGLN